MKKLQFKFPSSLIGGTKGKDLFLPKGANNFAAILTISDTTAKVTVFTAGGDDSDLKALCAVTDDTAAINLKIWITRSSVDYLLGTVNIPAGAGSSGALASTDLLAQLTMPGLPVDSMGKPYIPLKTGDVVKVSCLATMTTAKSLWVSAFGQDY